MKLEFSGQMFEKHSNIKFHEILSSGSRVIPCGWTDMSKLTVAVRDFTDVPKIQFTFSSACFHQTQTVEYITEVHIQLTALSAF
jgi:hypothetical protein